MNGQAHRADVDPGLLEESPEDLYEHAPCGYLTTLADGTVVKINETLVDWLGHDRDDLLDGRRFQDLLTVGGKVFHDTHYAPLLHMQGFAHEMAFDLVRRDGARLPVLLNSSLSRNEAGRPALIRTTIFNATERRRYERELLYARRRAEEAARARADFVSTISHEIRTPLSNILLVADLLAESDPRPDQEEPLRILHTACENLRMLVDDVLDLGKLEAGKLELDPNAFDLRDLIAEVVDAGRMRANAKGLELRAELDPALPPAVIGDRSKLGQVFTNLVANALKFTHRGGVTVVASVDELEPDAAVVNLRVVDTGVGIPADRMAQIFEDFTQAGAGVATRYGGTGLGLSISQKLVQLHGGRIEVESEPEVGSTFCFRLRLPLPPEP